jgi:myo-inositol-1(or 4)-monophosphatase
MDYLSVAIQAAKQAGKIHKKYFLKNLRIETKSSNFDLLTTADKEAETAAIAVIKKYFPGHNFLAEENIYNKTNSGFTWIIDPLDGTNNFASGMPIFCSSVALTRNNQVIVGAVFDVSRNELFYAKKGKGAYLNGKRIKVSKVNKLTRSIIITGFYYSRGKEMLETLETIKIFLLKGIIGIRRLGSAALDLCYVASGRAAGFWEFSLSPWDFAAGKLIIEEAGGLITEKAGGKVIPSAKSFIVASNGKIHRQMLDVINRVGIPPRR